MSNIYTIIIFIILLLHQEVSGQFNFEDEMVSATATNHISYMASLQTDVSDGEFTPVFYYHCSALFIKENVILTLATCFYENNVLLEPEQIRVVAGPHHRYNIELATFYSELEEFRIHENFSRSSLENNIAVGILPISFSKNDPWISVLDLEDIAIFPPVSGSKCKIYGWSLTTKFEILPNLLSGEVQIEDHEKCDVSGNKVTSTTICAGPNYVNGCETDSGGPLICHDIVFALIDYRPQNFCSKLQNVLGTYVGLYEFHDWIADQTDSSSLISVKFSLILLSLIIQLSQFLF